MPKPKSPEESLKSLTKVVAVLGCFSVDKRALSVGEISKTLDYPTSTTHRLLSSMKTAGLLDQDRQRGRYKLGLRLFGFGNIVLANMDLHREALQIIESLQHITNLSIHLAVFDGLRAVVVRRSEPNGESGMPSTMLENAPSYCTSVGKAALAFQSEEVFERVVNAGLERFTDTTIHTKSKLKTELARIRKRGYSVDDGEHQPGIRCVGAPIRNENGQVFASISASGPSRQVTKEAVAELSKIVRYHADQISKRLGFDH